jgi:predicted HD phosphohydrolase
MEITIDQHAQFTDLQHSKEEDWKIIGEDFKIYASKLADRVIAHLQLLDGDFGGFPVDRLTHSLQTATRAHRDGKDEEYVICALLHDIGDT